MQHLFTEHGDKVYQTGYLKSISKDILKWCENNDISINNKAKTKLLDEKYWQKLADILNVAKVLKAEIGEAEFDDFNLVKESVNQILKTNNIKLSASGKNAILNAVSWYDENAAKVVKKVITLSTDKLTTLLQHLGCTQQQLPDYGYYPSGKTNQFIIYQPNSDLRDVESIPLANKDNNPIHRYFLAKVKPHVQEAWINLDSTKIGYEVSFNKYFYRHKPLRSLEQVTQEIIDLERKGEGLIAQILGVDVADIQGGA